jgi:phage terminase large subunit-like protein
MNCDDRLRESLRQLSPSEIPALLAASDADEQSMLHAAWDVFAHPHQRPPACANNGGPWTTWLLIGGRGAGKTRAGAEWVRHIAQAPRQDSESERRIALIGETEHETREVMIEGVSGLLAVHARDARPLWTPSRRRLEWDNGAIAETFSADNPESLRGPQFSAAWCDELAKWKQAESTFDMLQFGLRLGLRPQQVITTTPRSTALLKRLIADPASAVTRAPTRANAYHLSPAFIAHVVQRYDGTRLGRQELDGEIVEDRPDALWSRALLEMCRVADAPALQRIGWRSIRRRHPARPPMPAGWSRPGLPRTVSAM